MNEQKTAYLFPGQGAQAVGMGKDIYDAFASARAVFQEADEALGFAISRLCFEGPDDELRQTVNTQPAILVTSLACLAAARETGRLAPDAPVACTAGHSLGEYTALVVAGAVSFADGVRLVRERGRLMQLAGDSAPGAMAAVMGLDDAVVAEVCRESGAEMANINAPGQIVISGPAADVEKASELARARGARRVVPLAVSGAFHSRLMLPAAEGLATAIGGVVFADARIPVVSNVAATLMSKADEFKDELVRQLTSPVRWTESVQTMVAAGVERFIEIGPGQVLTGLVKRIHEAAETQNIGDAKSVGG